MQDLEEFAAAKEVPYRTRGVIVQPSAGPEWTSFPKPITTIAKGLLAKLSVQAAGRPTNNNGAESRWCLLTTKFHSNVRNASARHMSDFFEKDNPKIPIYVSTWSQRNSRTYTVKAEGSCVKTIPSTKRSFVIITRRANESFMQRSRPWITLMTLELEILPTKKTREKSSLKTRNQKGEGGVE
jgi:hypothetical protein